MHVLMVMIGNGGYWLVGDSVSAADTMMGFSVQFVFVNGLAGQVEDGKWARVKQWLDRIEEREEYQRAVEKTGFELVPQV